MIWKNINGFLNYEVSDTGNVRNKKTGRILKPRYTLGGYIMVMLYLNKIPYNKYVHRLVAEAFIPNPDNKKCVDHIDTIRDNNLSTNLHWVTRKENQNNPITIQHFKISNKGKEIYFKKNRLC